MIEDGFFEPVDYLGPFALLGMALRAALHVRLLRNRGVHASQLRRVVWYHCAYLIAIAIALLLGLEHVVIAIALSVLITTEGSWIGQLGMYTKTLRLYSELKEHYEYWERHLASEEVPPLRGRWLERIWVRLRPPSSHREWHARRDELVTQISAQFALQTLVIHLAIEGAGGLPSIVSLLSRRAAAANPDLLGDLFLVVLEAFVSVLLLAFLSLLEFILMSMALGPIMAFGMHLDPKLVGRVASNHELEPWPEDVSPSDRSR
ncbi:MAG: hypothetical protein LC667_11865 [Thioalkalivibrio sp.]|nr:hypothetical protein [Thioalkalivibrio sp.]